MACGDRGIGRAVLVGWIEGGGYMVEADRNFWIGGSGIWNEEEGERWLGESGRGDPEGIQWSGGGVGMDGTFLLKFRVRGLLI